MRRVLLGVAGCVLGLSLAGAAQAHEHGPYRPAPYHGHGVRFSGGTYYTRYAHPHWEGRVWDSHYRRYHYYDPYLRVYYYWDPVRIVWVPVGCPESALPVVPVAPYPG